MKVAVIGLGYVGCVTSACLAKLGHTVVGVDTDPYKIAMMNRGESPLTEPDLDALLLESVNSGRLYAVPELRPSLADTHIAIVCVGTPSSADGAPNLKYVNEVFDNIETALSDRAEPIVIAIRSTVLPGTSDHFEKRLRQSLNRDNIVVCSHPEFLREGSAVKDFFEPPFIVVGTRRDEVVASFETLYRDLPDFTSDLIHVTAPEASEVLKYACNAFHAVKVAFANEVGTICHALGIDSQQVMKLFVKDTKLNVSKAYLRPGFAFGGSCLPKDLRALTAFGSQQGHALPMLSAVLASNRTHLHNTIRRIVEMKPRRVVIWGLSFKANTDDVRESPVVDLLEALLKEDIEVRWYDPPVGEALDEENSGQTDYLLSKVPNARLLCANRPDELREYPDLHVVTKKDPNFVEHLRSATVTVFDLTGEYRLVVPPDRYVGLLW